MALTVMAFFSLCVHFSHFPICVDLKVSSHLASPSIIILIFFFSRLPFHLQNVLTRNGHRNHQPPFCRFCLPSLFALAAARWRTQLQQPTYSKKYSPALAIRSFTLVSADKDTAAKQENVKDQNRRKINKSNKQNQHRRITNARFHRTEALQN